MPNRLATARVATAPAYLENFPGGGKPPQQIALAPIPFRIGRSNTANWVIYSKKVSKVHAEIWQENGSFRIRDLASRNGTFINGKRVDETSLVHGDILHIAHEEFRFSWGGNGAADSMPMTDPVTSQLPASVIRAGELLQELLSQELVFAVFQPIVTLPDGELVGFEALGRGRHSTLSPNPGDLFRLAEKYGRERELSWAFRKAAIRDLIHLPDRRLIFLNLHPAEIWDDHLVHHLGELRSFFRPHQRMILEINESSVANLEGMQRLRQQLVELDIGLAFDDFGVGQTRLLELAEIPPDFIKLDMTLIRDLGEAKVRQEIVQSLCQMIKNRGVQLIAEGIETQDEAEVCTRLGCNLGQGFLFERPQPALALKQD